MKTTSISKGPALLYMEKTLQKKSWQHKTVDFKVNLIHRPPLPVMLYSSPCFNGNHLLINVFIPASAPIYHSCCKLPGTGRAGFKHSMISNVTKAI